MNLLSYTKKLSEKITYYDTLVKGKYITTPFANPFAQPVKVTVIWVDKEDYMS